MKSKYKELNLCGNSNLFHLDYKFRYIVKNLKCIKVRIKAAIERIRFGVSRYDSWDFDHYITTVIENGLKFLKDAGNSYPSWCSSYEDWQRKLEYMIKLSELTNLYEDEVTNDSFNKYLTISYRFGKDSEECKKAANEWLEDAKDFEDIKNEARHKVLREIEKYIDDLWD